MDNSAINKVSYGLYVLTTNDGQKNNGCIINTVMQITSFEPFHFVVSVNKNNYSHETIQKTKKFNVSALNTDTIFDVIERFGFHSGRDTDKFDGYKYKVAENGIAYLEQYCNSYFSFDVLEEFDFGSHTVFKVLLVDAKQFNDKESLTYSYYHKHINPKNKIAKENEGKGYMCTICGYIHEGEELPDDIVCPLCLHGAADFIKL